MIDYLEIGVAQGENMVRVLQNNPTYNYTGIDRWECVPLENEVNKMSNWNTQEKWDEVYNQVLEKAKPFGTRASIIRGNSVDVLPTLKNKFDIIYVDGDHSYEGAKKDIEMSLELLKDENSKIVVDDLHYSSVKRAFNEVIRERELRYKGDTIWQR
jgi:hypothetical protein